MALNKDNVKISRECNVLIGNVVAAGLDYLNYNRAIESLIIGISGGVDSALTAAIARKTCDTAGIPLRGFALPISGNGGGEMERAVAVGETYCHRFQVVNLNDTFMALMNGVDFELWRNYRNAPNPPISYTEKVRAGNIKARTRMVFLYNMAAKYRGMVLSTDNLTEYLLGFWTLHGDVGDFGFIQELWKTEVYGMGEVIGGPVMDCVLAKPTDGLGVSDNDIEQLLPGWEGTDYRAAYEHIDTILIDTIEGSGTFDPSHPVIQRFKDTGFKRNNPANVARDLALWKFRA
jgi:NAD+ synthetase